LLLITADTLVQQPETRTISYSIIALCLCPARISFDNLASLAFGEFILRHAQAYLGTLSYANRSEFVIFVQL